MTFSSPFPSFVSFVSLFEGDVPSGARIASEEQKLLRAKASPKRIREFTLGRIASRMALEGLGLDSPPPVLAGSRGEPIWPTRVTGSISHTDTCAVAAVCNTDRLRGLGLDIQVMKKDIRAEVAERICLPGEIEWCRGGDFIERMLEIFSAKETIFKTLYPLCRTMFFFHDAELTASPEGGFCSVLRKDLRGIFPAGFQLDIGAVRQAGLLMTYATLPAESLS